jgi:putative hemolysin
VRCAQLVPKQLALLAPETVASGVARPFRVLSRMALPLVWVLSVSSSLILGLLGARRQEAPPVTDEEIKERIAQRAATGVFHASGRSSPSGYQERRGSSGASQLPSW